MKIISALSLQIPSMSLCEFHDLSARALESNFCLKELSSVETLAPSTRRYLTENGAKALAEATALAEFFESRGVDILYPGHPSYSPGFYDLEDPPLFLSVEGNWPAVTSIAIVGSREPSRYAVDWLGDNIPEVLSRTECLVVSGGARGIDLAAHLAAAKSGKATLVFLPSGLENFYPRDLKRYKELILETGGGFVSELPPHEEMRKFHFIKRNRLIVASSDLVFVAEARRKSGSMLTANIARRMNRTVCTLPAAPTMNYAQGSLDLVFDGAFPIRDHLDLTALVNISSRRV